MDFALSKEQKFITNIAITGPYGSGKSTIWSSYEAKRKEKLGNVITVSFSKYYESLGEKKLNIEHDHEFYNRIERQILNDLVIQIDPKKIPLYINKVKKNRTNKELAVIISCCISLFSGIIGLIKLEVLSNILKSIFSNAFLSLFLLFLVLTIVPIITFLLFFLKNIKVNVFQFNIKNIKAKTENEITSNETILEREIKEIIYLLYNSGAEIIIFEDLDRFGEIKLFEKLKNINILLNKYVLSKKNNKIFKFIYMVPDNLLDSDGKTKFFNFIIPTLQAKNSKPILEKNIKKFNIINTLIDILPKITDNIRIINNIINEYIIYKKLLGIPDENEINTNNKLEKEKITPSELIGMLTFKNVMPDEFSLFQKNKGFVYTILINKSLIIEEAKMKISNKINQINNEIKYVKSSYFEDTWIWFISKHIPFTKFYESVEEAKNSNSYVNGTFIDEGRSPLPSSMMQLLREFIVGLRDSVIIKETKQTGEVIELMDFQTFWDRYIKTDKKLHKSLNNLQLNYKNKINKLDQEEKELMYILSNIDNETINNLFLHIDLNNCKYSELLEISKSFDKEFKSLLSELIKKGYITERLIDNVDKI
ncbi:hypothetical protein [Mycoplasma feriruminatoris]|uniref:YobI family P-loop NTPase n=1 Tax=Mycoplasma feriruminatoris TaxID=1179777 RepID=UPI00241F78FB|nr:hypothetical protein [Mycoplasma feriruminatoris]